MRPGFLGVLAGMLIGHGAAWSAIVESIPDFEVADRLVPDDPLPARELRLAGGVTVLTDVVYSALHGFRPLRLDLYRASAGGPKRPLVVFVHGGGWWTGSPRGGAAFLDFPSVLADLASRGIVVASIEYRLSGEAPFPAPLLDLQAAIRFLRTNGARFGIDPEKVVLWGMSAGAQIAALDAVSCSKAVSGAPDPEQPGRGDCVLGFVGWFGAYALTDAANASPPDDWLREYLNCGPGACSPAVLAAASPITMVDASDPPMLLIHGARDQPEESREFASRLRASGVPVEFLLIPDVEHGFIGTTKSATKQASRQALAATFDFFERLFAATPGQGSDHR